MGAKPQAPSASSMLEEAKKIVRKAYERQKETTEKLQERGELYEGKRETSQAELDKLFGMTGAEALSKYEQGFETGIPALTGVYETKQGEFQPNVLDLESPSSSFNLLSDVLRGSAKEYGTAMNKASGQASSRLYEALAAPVAGFEAIANRPAFNKLYDPTFMEIAKKPPTVTSDVDSFKSLYTYNV